MRVGIDMHWAQNVFATAGIGSYSLEHIAHLQQHPDVEVILFQPIFEGMTRAEYVQELSGFILENQIDVFHLPSPMTIPYPDVIGTLEMPDVRLTATVFDLIPLVFPDLYQPHASHRSAYKQHLRMLYRVHRLLSISQHTHHDLIRFGYPANQVTTISTGSSDLFFRMRNAHLNDFTGVFPTDKPYVLAFSAWDVRKNIFRTVQAFSIATRDKPHDYQLVVVGDAPTALREKLQKLATEHGRPGSVHFTGRISTSQLLRLFNRATATAMLSLYEGWGLPVLESLQCGVPVLASNTTSLPEVAGDAAVYADPTDIHSIANGFTRLLSEPGIKEALAARSEAAAARHQWADVASRTVHVFEQLMQEIPVLDQSRRLVGQHGRMDLQPNRYRVLHKGPHRSSRTYVSFDMQEVPAGARIVRAVLRFPMKRHARKPVVRGVKVGWSVDSVERRRPHTRALRSGALGRVKLSGRGSRAEKILHWPCTKVARRWMRHPLRNHGIMIQRATSRPPVLTVTYDYAGTSQESSGHRRRQSSRKSTKRQRARSRSVRVRDRN